MLTLHATPGTISVAVAIALEEAGLDWTPALVDFAAGQQSSAAYLAINPKGRVPALDVGGEILTETGALLDYVASIAPDAGLVPQDPVAAARMREVMYYLASTMHVNHAHKMRGSRWADDPAAHQAMAAKVPETMTASAAHIEATCALAPYALGADATLADPYLFMVCSWLPGDGVDMGQFPKITAYLDAMRARSSVQKVIQMGLLT